MIIFRLRGSDKLRAKRCVVGTGGLLSSQLSSPSEPVQENQGRLEAVQDELRKLGGPQSQFSRWLQMQIQLCIRISRGGTTDRAVLIFNID